MERIAATVLFALGSFGADVASTLRTRLRTREDGRVPDLALCELPTSTLASAPALGAAADTLDRELRRQLALSALVEQAPLDASRPWLDVIVVGALGEPQVRRALLDLLEAVERVASGSFRNLLGRKAERVTVTALLRVGDGPDREAPGAADGPTASETLELLGRERGLKVRSFLLEDQTSRYILSGQELVSTAVAAIELLTLGGLRDSEQLGGFLRDEAPRCGPSAEWAPFATLGVACVHVDAPLVHAYCRTRAALGLVEAMRSGPDLGLAEREERARELRVSWDGVREHLGLAAQSEAAFEQIERLVLEEAPTFPCPEIDAEDSPEEIRERKFGDDWYRAVGGAIDQLIERLERRRMLELSTKISSRGLEQARRRRQTIKEAVDGWFWRAPRGWAAARSTLTLLRDEAAASEAEAGDRIYRLALPEMPTPDQLHQPVIALREETERRPRPSRLWLSGALLSLVALLASYPLLGLLEYPLRALEAPLWLLELVSPPWGTLLAGAICGAAIASWLRALVRRRQAELVEVRAELRRRIDDLVTGRKGSVLAYYLARLELARELWVLRLARLERHLLEEELARLGEVQRALDTLRERLRAAQQELGELAEDASPGSGDLNGLRQCRDLILREAVDGELLQGAYAAAVPDEEELPGRFFQELRSVSREWRLELPMADRRVIDEFLGAELDLPGPAELMARREGAGGEATLRAIERVCHDLLTRLSPTLGLNEAFANADASWIIWGPETSRELVAQALEDLRGQAGVESLGRSWLYLPSPRDDGRVYLASLVTRIPLRAVEAVER